MRFFKTWLASQPATWRERIEIVAMDGFTGFTSAAAAELPGARAVMDPLYKARRMLHTRSCQLAPCQQHQIPDLFASDSHVALEVTWSVYQTITWCLPHARHGRG